MLQVFRDIPEVFPRVLDGEPKIRRRIRALRGGGQLKKQACHSLSVIIVQFPRDPAAFVFLQGQEAAGQSLEFETRLHGGRVLRQRCVFQACQVKHSCAGDQQRKEHG